MSANFLSPSLGVSTIIPASYNPKTLSLGSQIVYDYKYILYNQIHAIKNNYNFGNISNETTLNLELWNAFEYTDVSIDNVTYENLSGVELLNRDLTPLDIPVDIKHIESALLAIRVSLDGDSSNDGSIIINVGGIDVVIGVSLSRSFLFDFDINTINNIKEYYVFNTRIIPSLNNTEQRFARIDIPRVRLEYFYTLSDKQKRSLDAILYANNTNFSIPLYTQTRVVQSIVTDIVTVDVTNTCIQPGIDVLIKDIYTKEVIKVLEVIDMNHIRLVAPLGNIYVNPILIPCISGKLPGSNTKLQKTKNLAEYTLTFDKNIDDVNTLVTNNNTAQLNKYKDLFILEDQNTGDDVNYTYEKDILLKDNGYSKTDTTIYNNVATIDFNYSNYAVGKDDISTIKNFFNYQKGMFQDLYSRSFTNNVKVVENIAAGDIIITVENNNLAMFYEKNKIKQIYFKYNDNKEIILDIVNISKVDDEKENILLSNGFGEAIPLGGMISADFVWKGRLNDDVLTIDYNSFKVARYDLTFHKSNDVE